MKNRKNYQLKSVDSHYYSKKYFLSWGEYPRFLKTKGFDLFRIQKRIIQISNIKSGMKVLEIGCGRGELLVAAARLGAEVYGIDYAPAAIFLAKKSVLLLPKRLKKKVFLDQKSIRDMNLRDNYYDRIFMVQLIEHLRQWEVDILLEKVKKALAKDGKIIIHTWPNRLVLDYGYSVFNLWQFIRGKPLIKTKREKIDRLIHVNEQSPISLKRVLRKHSFMCKVWLEKDGFFENLRYFARKKGGVRKYVIKILGSWPFNFIFFNEIYAIARRDEKKNTSL